MKNLQLLFLGIFFTLAFSWVGLILTSHLNLGQMQPTTSELEPVEIEGKASTMYDGQILDGDPLYPIQLGGIALTGKDVYADLGCMYCHTQQIRPKGFGKDYERGWGDRQTVARDYIFQKRVLLGTMRTGPDLADVGTRLPSKDWHMNHLYNPRLTSPGSVMPPFPFLFDLVEIIGSKDENALSIPADSPYAPPVGYQIIPNERAEALVAYLMNLKVDYELPEMKFTEE